MTDHPLLGIPRAVHAGRRAGIVSVCSAHPVVLEATLRRAARREGPVLIEATCNQVNQEGGYTGMEPAAFRDVVAGIAARAGCPMDRVVLGGDHLGPNPWKALPAERAMEKAEAMIAAYAAAGFTKLHLDCSMGCAGEPAALDDARTAERAARLAAAAEAHAPGGPAPVYVIGTEVPIPGGATHASGGVAVTAPEAAARTRAVHRDAFAARGLEDAFARVIGLVVQPGVEFGQGDVHRFDPEAAAPLSAALGAMPGLVYEAHSTDYQHARALRDLVAGGFAILKVGPWLTFALREALYGLDAIADALDGHPPQGRLMECMEAAMQARPQGWRGHASDDPRTAWVERHFGLADRIRYYWPDPAARAAVADLMERLAERPIPAPLASQHLGHDPGGADLPNAKAALLRAVETVLAAYDAALAD